MDYEVIVRRLLQGRVCLCGVAKDSEVAWDILARDLEVLLREQESNG